MIVLESTGLNGDAEGLNLSFKSVGNFISKNVKSGVKDTKKVVKIAAPLIGTAATFIPGVGGVVGKVIDKVANSKVVKAISTVKNSKVGQAAIKISKTGAGKAVVKLANDLVINPQIQKLKDQLAASGIKIPTDPQIKTLAEVKNTTPEAVLQGIANDVDANHAKATTLPAPTVPTEAQKSTASTLKDATPPKDKDNTLLYAGLGLGSAAVVYYAFIK